MAVYKLVMVRHGESEFNKENRFCGWYDADLADTGVDEARKASKMMIDKNIYPDKAYTSVLKRAIKTLFYIQDGLDRHWIPVVRDWRLNERMYGALTGLNKAETAAKHGEEQVKIWRRSYDVPPPHIEESNPFNPRFEAKYQGLKPNQIPLTECLKDTVARVVPVFKNEISADIKKGLTVIVVAHGNTIRALIKHLDNVKDDEIANIDIPTGIPMVYELDKGLKPVKHYYLASDDVVNAAIAKVKNQGQAQLPSLTK